MPKDFRHEIKAPLLGRFSISGSGSLCMTILVPVLLLCSWLLPLHFLPWVSWHSEVFAFFAVGLCASVAVFRQVIKDKRLRISLPVSAMPFITLALLAVAQVASGLMTFAGDALVFCFYSALCVTALALGYASGTNSADKNSPYQARKVLVVVAFTLLVAALISALVAFTQVLELWEGFVWINRMPYLRRPGGNIGQPNQLATLLLMGMASLLFLHESGRLKDLSLALILLVLVVALAVTESRTGVLSFLLLSGWWLLKNKRVGFRLPPRVIGLLVIGFLGFFLAWPSIFNFIQQSSGAGAEINTKVGLRLVVWPQLLEAMSQRPWAGWGLNQVPWAHNAVASSYTLSEPYSYSHNILIDLALGLGLPLAAMLVFVSGFWLWRRARLANQLLPWYCIALVLPVAVHSMLEFPFTYAYFLAPVMFVLGVLEGLSGAKQAFTMGARPATALLVLIGVVAAWSVVEYIKIEEDFRVVRFEALRVGKTPVSYQRPHIFLLTQLDALLASARVVPKLGMSPGELELSKKVALRYPWTATQNRYALSLALNGNPEEALRQLRVMRALHGEVAFAKISENWKALAQEKYPQLNILQKLGSDTD